MADQPSVFRLLSPSRCTDCHLLMLSGTEVKVTSAAVNQGSGYTPARYAHAKGCPR